MYLVMSIGMELLLVGASYLAINVFISEAWGGFDLVTKTMHPIQVFVNYSFTSFLVLGFLDFGLSFDTSFRLVIEAFSFPVWASAQVWREQHRD